MPITRGRIDLLGAGTVSCSHGVRLEEICVVCAAAAPPLWSSHATGTSGDVEIEQAFLRQLQVVFETFCRKQRDYGRGNIAKFGARGVLVRLSDKVERMVNLDAKVGREPVNESIADSWLDAATYSVIGMVCRAGDWPGSPEAK